MIKKPWKFQVSKKIFNLNYDYDCMKSPHCWFHYNLPTSHIPVEFRNGPVSPEIFLEIKQESSNKSLF